MISPEHDPGRERERALEVHETPLAIEREIGNKMGEAQDPGNIGPHISRQSDPDAAMRLHEEALQSTGRSATGRTRQTS
jgi:hypothetical protein